jgi:type I restriction enzyme M protein
MDSEKSKKNFELFSRLTDQSSEIETLFIERTKQLLKDGGMAGIILPSSILNNTGIYTQTREIILNYFEIISIVELGSNTFMATETNTVILFLRRKNSADFHNIKASVEKLFTAKQDITINGIETPLKKYLTNRWEDIGVDDYFTLLDKKPCEKLLAHKILKNYKSRLKGDVFEQIIQVEKEKLLYFIMAYPQKVTVVKTGTKRDEKKFLGYEFSNRRGKEGIHPTQKGKNIDECTSLYDEVSYTNPLKVNSYIYSAFNGEFKEIDKSLKKNISYVDLVDMINFDGLTFEKSISLSVKKRVNYLDIWRSDNLVELESVATITKGKTITERRAKNGNVPVVAGGQKPAYYHNKANREKDIITISASGAYSGFVNFYDIPIFASDCNTIKSKDENILCKYKSKLQMLHKIL